MKKEFGRSEGSITLKDQEFLKELGISGLSSGLEYALRQYEKAMRADATIEAKAEGYQSLELDEETLARLSDDERRQVSKLREELRMFRDLKQPPPNNKP